MTDVAHTPTLAEIVAANPATARTLDRLGLDYCCHGNRTIPEACAGTDLDPETVAAELATLDLGGDRSWTELEPPALADHIVETHHQYLHDELPLLDAPPRRSSRCTAIATRSSPRSGVSSPRSRPTSNRT